MPLYKLLSELNLPGSNSVDNACTSGTFTGTITGCTTSPTGTVRYVKVGKVMFLYLPLITGTSNTNAATITGAPAVCFPTRAQTVIGLATDNTTGVIGVFTIGTDGVITMANGATATTWTTSGTKAMRLQTISYALD